MQLQTLTVGIIVVYLLFFSSISFHSIAIVSAKIAVEIMAPLVFIARPIFLLFHPYRDL